jgi:hypothetical protein
LLLIALACCVAVSLSSPESEVTQLGEEQFNGIPSGVQLDKAAADDIAPGGEGTGHFTGMDNLLGPQYGQPGYAATHNWEGSNDVDFFSPLIFDWEAYALKYKDRLSDASEAEVKKDWLAKLDSLKYPNCRHGRKHDHAPGGFSLKLYYDANKATLQLGTEPTCKAIAQQFLSEGIFSATPWADVAGGEKAPFNDGNDGKVPPSSWLLCKWRRGGNEGQGIDLWTALARPYQLNQVYSRTIQPYDMVLSKQDGAMYGFKPTTKYSVSFWYRPKSQFLGEIFNFGQSINYGGYESRYWSPSAAQIAYDGDGVSLGFKVSTDLNKYNECKVKASADAVAKRLPWNTWTFVTLTVAKNTAGQLVQTVYYDNQKSTMAHSAKGTKPAGDAKVASVHVCKAAGDARKPSNSDKAQGQGFPVSSYIPDKSAKQPTNANTPLGDIAGLTYYNDALTVDQVSANYAYEQDGVKGWTPQDAAGNNNGVC